MPHGQRKKGLGSGGNPDHVKLGFGLGLTSHTPDHCVCFTPRLFDSNSSAGLRLHGSEFDFR